VNGQIPFRYKVILDILKEQGVDPAEIDVFVGRGGSACTQPGGVTRIDQKLYDDTEAAVGAGITSVLFFVTLRKIDAVEEEPEDAAAESSEDAEAAVTSENPSEAATKAQKPSEDVSGGEV
jgi:hypothetical protein